MRRCAVTAFAAGLLAGCSPQAQQGAERTSANAASPAGSGGLGGLVGGRRDSVRPAAAAAWYVGAWDSRGTCENGPDLEFTAGGAVAFRGEPATYRRDGLDIIITNRDGVDLPARITRQDDGSMVLTAGGASARHVRCDRAAVPPTASRSTGGTDWLIGRWGEGTACADVIELRSDGSWRTSEGDAGRWRAQERNGVLMVFLTGDEPTQVAIERQGRGFTAIEPDGTAYTFNPC